MHLLVVEHDDGAATVGTALERSGHTWCRSSVDHALIDHPRHDLLLLDLSLPGTSGLEVLTQLRTVSSVPIIVLTARYDERVVVRALQAGADDCLAKPVREHELLARIDGVLRRWRFSTGGATPHAVEIGDLSVDLSTRAVTRGTDVVILTKTEFDILAVLCACRGTTVPRGRILHSVWGDDSIATSKSLDVHLARLRAKLDRPGLITTIWGVGYRVS